MIIVFKYKGIQYLIKKKKYLKVKNINYEGKILIKKVMFIYNKKEILIGKPYIDKILELNSEIYKKEKKISLKFKKRKRFLKKKGYSNKIYKLSFLDIY